MSRSKTSDLDRHLTTTGGNGVRGRKWRRVADLGMEGGRASLRTLTIYSELTSDNRIVQYV